MTNIKLPAVFRKKLDWIDTLCLLALMLATIPVLLVAGLSLSWEIHWDALIWHYHAFLINEHGFVPYRDVFDPNMFGTVFFHVFATKIVGYDNWGMRLVDILWLAALMAITWRILIRFDWRVAWAGCLLYAWHYLAQGEMQYLQRDHLLILPIAGAVLLALREDWAAERPRLRALFIGVLFGLAASFKPQAVIGLPFVTWFDPHRPQPWPWPGGLKPEWKKSASALFWSGLGVAIPLALGFLWLWSIGALPAFWEIVTEYWPEYTHMVLDAGAFRMLTPEDHRSYVWRSVLEFKNFWGRQWLIIPAFLTLLAILRPKAQTSSNPALALLFAKLAAMLLIAVVLVGAFHPYNYMPAIYFLSMLTVLALVRKFPIRNKWGRLALLLTSAATTWLSLLPPPDSVYPSLQYTKPQTNWTRRGSAITAYLKPRLKPTDRIQPLDSFGGSLRAMMDLRAVNATAHTSDGHLFFAVESNYVRRMRVEFLNQLQQAKPRFIICVKDRRFDAHDDRETDEWPKTLAQWIKGNYHLATIGDGFEILEKH